MVIIGICGVQPFLCKISLEHMTAFSMNSILEYFSSCWQSINNELFLPVLELTKFYLWLSINGDYGTDLFEKVLTILREKSYTEVKEEKILNYLSNWTSNWIYFINIWKIYPYKKGEWFDNYNLAWIFLCNRFNFCLLWIYGNCM